MLMPAPHSNDLRQRVIDAYIAKAGSQRQLADRFQVSLSFVQRLVRRYQKTGQVTPLPHAGGATPKVNPEDLSIVQQLVDEQPDAILSVGSKPSKNGQPSTKDPSLQTDKLKTRLPVFTGLNEAARRTDV